MKKKTPFQQILKSTKEGFAELQDKVNSLKKTSVRPAKEDAPSFPSNEGTDHKRVMIEISARTVARATAVVLLLFLLFYFLYQISTILVIFFVSFLFAAALDPIIDFLHARKIPRSLGVLLVYLVIFLVLGILLSTLAPLLAKQIVDIAPNLGVFVQNLTTGDNNNWPFAQQLRPYLLQIYQAIDLNTAAVQLQSTLQIVASQLLNISFGLVNVILVFVLTFFMTVEEKAMENFFLSLFPSRYGKYITTRLEAVKEKIGYWLRGQLLVCLIAAVITYIGLLILRVDYALTHAVIAGILMLIPVLGRVFAWGLAFPIVFNQSPLLALWVTVFYFALQQLENNIIVPYVMNKAVGLSPIIIMFAMLVGAQYLGILGLVISIPIATTAAIFVKDYMEKSK